MAPKREKKKPEIKPHRGFECEALLGRDPRRLDGFRRDPKLAATVSGPHRGVPRRRPGRAKPPDISLWQATDRHMAYD